MKKIANYLLLTIFVVLAYSCGNGDRPSALSQLDEAEEALEIGHMPTAQQIADSLMLGDGFGTLDAAGLCRLTMLYVRLADENFPETNTSMAARALDAAYRLDSAATNDYIYNQMPPEQRPAVALVAAIVEARNKPANIDDSLCVHEDNIE